jgi:hypothetical protein
MMQENYLQSMNHLVFTLILSIYLLEFSQLWIAVDDENERINVIDY